MKGGKPKKATIKIITSQINKNNQQNLPSYDFNEVDPNIIRVNSYQSKYHKNLYFYCDERRNQQLIISTTMDFTNSLKFLFGLQLKNTPHHYIFKFQTLAELIRSNQQEDYSQEWIKQRLKPTSSNTAKRKIDFIQADEISTYYYPPMTQCCDIWLVPRYMHRLELEENMKIRFYHQAPPLSTKCKFKFTDVLIKKLALDYVIEQVYLSQIKNNQKLSKENQENLLHICDEIEQTANTDTKCYICMESSEEKIYTKNPDILIDVCYCSGGCKFVHMKCLKGWLKSKSSSVIIQCPTCKKPLPQFIEVTRLNKNKEKVRRYFHLIGSSKTPHVQLNNEVIDLFSNQTIFLGSFLTCNYLIDSPNKQNYAKIIFEPGVEKAYIEDLQSRFGTLVKKNNLVIKLNKQKQKPYTCTVLVEGIMYNITIEEGN